MKKRIIFALILALCVSVCLISCGGGEETGGESIGITYNLYGGTLPADAPKSFEEGKAPDFSKIVPTMENFVFDGWYADADYTSPASAAEVKNGKLTLFAKWTGMSYAINYELCGGESENFPTSYNYGEWLNLTSIVPTRSGYTFAGWYYDASLTEPAYSIDDETSGEITVYAKWVIAVNKKCEIEDVKKGFFGGEYNKLSIDLSDYVVNEAGVSVSYSVSSSSASVVSASVEGDLLTLEFLRGSGSSDITVEGFVEDVLAVEFEFTATPKTYTKIACVGDSLTHSAPSYPFSLEKLLEFTNIEVGNFGKSGASVSEYTNNDLYGAYVEYANAEYLASLAFDADLVIIMFGTNDATKMENGAPKFDWNDVAPVFKEAYISLINDYKAAYPNADIAIMTSPVVLSENMLSISNALMDENTYPLQCEIAEETGVTLIDLRPYLAGIEGMESFYKENDGVHFNEEGADAIADFILKSV